MKEVPESTIGKRICLFLCFLTVVVIGFYSMSIFTESMSDANFTGEFYENDRKYIAASGKVEFHESNGRMESNC